MDQAVSRQPLILNQPQRPGNIFGPASDPITEGFNQRDRLDQSGGLPNIPVNVPGQDPLTGLSTGVIGAGGPGDIASLLGAGISEGEIEQADIDVFGQPKFPGASIGEGDIERLFAAGAPPAVSEIESVLGGDLSGLSPENQLLAEQQLRESRSKAVSEEFFKGARERDERFRDPTLHTFTGQAPPGSTIRGENAEQNEQRIKNITSRMAAGQNVDKNAFRDALNQWSTLHKGQNHPIRQAQVDAKTQQAVQESERIKGTKRAKFLNETAKTADITSKLGSGALRTLAEETNDEDLTRLFNSAADDFDAKVKAGTKKSTDSVFASVLDQLSDEKILDIFQSISIKEPKTAISVGQAETLARAFEKEIQEWERFSIALPELTHPALKFEALRGKGVDFLRTLSHRQIVNLYMRRPLDFKEDKSVQSDAISRFLNDPGGELDI